MSGKLQRRVIFRRISFPLTTLGTLARFLARANERSIVRSSQTTMGERRTGKGEQVDSRIGVPGSTSNDTVVVSVLLRFCPERLPSLVAARFLITLSLSFSLLSHRLPSARRHSRRAALSGSARKSGAAATRRREKRGGKRDRGRSPQTPAIRRRERRTKDGARAADADATRRESGAEGEEDGADGWGGRGTPKAMSKRRRNEATRKWLPNEIRQPGTLASFERNYWEPATRAR